MFLRLNSDSNESILSEDPTPAETTHHSSGGLSASASGSNGVVGVGAGASIDAHGHEKQQSTLLILAAVVAIGAVIVTSIIVAGIVVVCRHRPRPPEPQDVRKSMRTTKTGATVRMSDLKCFPLNFIPSNTHIFMGISAFIENLEVINAEKIKEEFKRKHSTLITPLRLHGLGLILCDAHKRRESRKFAH
ncbi:unnamed protein product [Ceratitis capitata]|uniref:(Mediterranean fruit fly) hypothetical protein n=1 Tax=Ceratitis capitata TaxID=7213 RepID=A0A811U663_CERCA|nr:unnamed protein product [Ceratitis capitata]